MKPWLYLTPEGTATASLDWPCGLWSSTGQRQLQPMQQAAQILKGLSVNVLLPMELCSWVRSEPWPSRRRPDLRAIAFAVEEQLGEPLENLHLSLGTPDPSGRYPVMVIERDRFACILQLLQTAGINVASISVDADRLPPDQARGVRWFGRWLLGGALPSRLALSTDDLALLNPGLPEDVQWRDEPADSIDPDSWLLEESVPTINLLHGEFARRQTNWPWRLVGVTVGLMLLVSWGASAARVNFLESQSAQLQARSEQQFKALYPEQTRIVDLAAQLTALQGSSATPQGGRIAGLVTLVERVLGASPVEIRRVEFREDSGWRIQLSASSFTELETLREHARQQGIAVRIDSASKDRERVQATLILEQDL